MFFSKTIITSVTLLLNTIAKSIAKLSALMRVKIRKVNTILVSVVPTSTPSKCTTKKKKRVVSVYIRDILVVSVGIGILVSIIKNLKILIIFFKKSLKKHVI